MAKGGSPASRPGHGGRAAGVSRLDRMSLQERTRTEAAVEAKERWVARGVATGPVAVARAEGAWIEDVDGRRFLDFAGGIGCQNTGHNLPAVVEALREQLDRYLHQCFVVGMYEPYVEVCRRLAELSPCRGAEQKSFLANSGAEALENAVKISRAATGRPAVVVFQNALPRADAPRDDDDLEARLQEGLRAVRAGGLPHAGPVPLPGCRRPPTRSRASSGCSRATSTRRASPASSSSPCRARAASSRCRPTSRRACASSATVTASSTWTTRSRRGCAGRARCGRSSTTASSRI